jgi:hypothetical protein
MPGCFNSFGGMVSEGQACNAWEEGYFVILRVRGAWCVGTARADSRRPGVGLAPTPQALPAPAVALVLSMYKEEYFVVYNDNQKQLARTCSWQLRTCWHFVGYYRGRRRPGGGRKPCI